jgi:diaminopimelate epimerase
MTDQKLTINFCKYHALGNDYIVLPSESFGGKIMPSQIRQICHRHYGIGSDGILWGPIPGDNGVIGLRIFNPDGSEAEKSGNGLRIFTRYLWEKNGVRQNRFVIETLGGIVEARVFENGNLITVDMGRVSFESSKIPVGGPAREVIDETLMIEGQEFRYSAATVGNPHCVILCDDPNEEQTRRWGPRIETDARFPNRTNVQFMKVIDRENIQIEIWERGAGYTLASGSSSCAAAAAARRMGLCDNNIKVHMPGGTIQIAIDDDYSIRMTGPVTKVAEGVICADIFLNNRDE